MPRTLPEAYTTAQTVYYDDQYLHLDQHREIGRFKQPNFPKNPQHGVQRPIQKTQPGFNRLRLRE